MARPPRVRRAERAASSTDLALRAAWINLYSVVLDADPQGAGALLGMQEHYFYMRELRMERLPSSPD